MHCQICGREMGLLHGTLPHHSNPRIRTACFGSRYEPYEKASDALPLAIENTERAKRKWQAMLDDLLCNPPERFMVRARPSFVVYEKPRELPRPTNFKITDVSYVPRTYTHEFNLRCRELENEIAILKKEIAIMQERLKNWQKGMVA